MIEIGFEFCSEKISGKGEDAPPIRHKFEDNAWVLLVCDGMGGAGSIPYASCDGKTGAKIGAESVAAWAKGFFEAIPDVRPRLLDEQLASEFHAEIAVKLKCAADELDSQETTQSKLRSKLHKRLPTTLACITLAVEQKELRAQAIWAGDSRCFCMTSDDGLQQLSVDDQKQLCDPFESLSLDPQMSNYVNADTEFIFNSARFGLPLPAVLLVATDGCFQYVETPAHFEELLLSSLAQAASTEEWSSLLSQRIEAVTGDDASMSLQAVGWTSFESLKSAFAVRRNQLSDVMHASESAPVQGELFEPENHNFARRYRREQLWQAYKKGYSARMPVKIEEGDHAVS